jgi:PLP dependent protein
VSAESDARVQELQRGLQETRDEIRASCRAHGRDIDDVHLIVVTKTWPADDVHTLADLGVRDVGENKAQELLAKRAECSDRDLTWHFIGRLQSNKARQVGAHADVVHSVDRDRLLEPLASGWAERADQTSATELSCLVQVSLDPPGSSGDGRGGAAPEAVPALAEGIASTPGLRLRGVMGVAPLEADPRPAFDLLRDVRDRLLLRHPEAHWISAGMSGDLDAAIAAGATHLRVGSAILGTRRYVG